MNIPDPAGFWVFPDGREQPVANVPGWAERFHNNSCYGWTWKPYQRTDAAPQPAKEGK